MRLKIRGCTSITLLLAFIILAVSGVVLYIMPHGRVAYWIHWTFWGLSKDDWDAVHTIFGYVFMLTGACHIFLNRKAIVSYMMGTFRSGRGLKKELILSVLLMVLIAAGTIEGVPPFSTVMDFGASVKDSWGSGNEDAPVPHTEQFTLKEIAESLGLSTEEIAGTLKEHGIEIENTDETLQQIALRYNVSPQDLYRMIHPREGKGTGLGRGRNRRY